MGSGTLSAASVTIEETGGDNRSSEITISTGSATIAGDIQMDGSALRNAIRFLGAGTLNLAGNFTGINGGVLVPSTGTVNLTGGSPQLIQGANTKTFYNLIINKSAAANTVTSAAGAEAFIVLNNLGVQSGNLFLYATDANYVVGNDVIAASAGTITHGVDLATGKFFAIGGSIEIDGVFNYTVPSEVRLMNSTLPVQNENVRTGANPLSAFYKLSLRSANYFATGIVSVNNVFLAMDNTASGSFHTNGMDVYANGALSNSGGTLFVDGGSLNVTGGTINGDNFNGTMNISSGTFNTDVLTIGSANTGTFMHSGGVVNISADVTFTKGNYTCTGSPVINISGNWRNNLAASAFIPATSTITFNSTSAAQTIGGTASSQNLGNVFINKSGQQLSVAGSTTTLSITGELNLMSGSFAAGTATSINIAGHLTNNGTTFNAGASNIQFNGSIAQVIGGSKITTFNKLTVNNPTVVSLNNVDAIITGTPDALTFSNGRFTTGAKKLIIGAGGITGASATRYVFGNLQMAVATGTTTRVFEIGDAAIYAPVSVVFNAVTTAGNVTAFTTGTEHPNILSSTIDETKSVNRFWTLTNSAVLLTSYTPTFNWATSDVDASALTGNFIIGRRSGSWAYPTMLTRTANSCSATLGSFGEVAVGEGGAGLPVMSVQPNDATVCSGSTATFTASANSKPSATAQWRVSTNGGVSYTAIILAAPYSVSTSVTGSITTSTLTINPVPASMSGYQYQVLFTNSRGNCVSAEPVLTVTQAATANAGSALATICGSAISAPLGGVVGGTATGGTWTSNSGGTFSPNANTLNATWTPAAGFSGAATLTLTTTGGSCGTASASKVQNVTATPPVITITPASATICNGAIQKIYASNTDNFTASSGTINLAIPNNSATGAANAINISTFPAGAKITGISVIFNVAHPEVADLQMNLRAPNGKVLNLANRPSGGAGGNFTNTVVSSTGTTLFSSATSPFTGTFKADAGASIGATGQVSNATLFSELYSVINGDWVT